MQANEFNATLKNGYIPVPEPYRSQIKKSVKVIILETSELKVLHPLSSEVLIKELSYSHSITDY